MKYCSIEERHQSLWHYLCGCVVAIAFLRANNVLPVELVVAN